MTTSDSLLQSNLQLLTKSHPRLSLELKLTPIFSHNLPPQLHLNLDDSSFTRLLLYGAAVSSNFPKIEDWLKSDTQREVVLFEDEIEILKSIFSQELGAKILKHPRIHILYIDSPNFWERDSSKIKKFLSQPFQIQDTRKRKLNKKASFSQIKEKLTSLSIEQNVLFAEYLHVSPLVYENILNNFSLHNRASHLSSLKGIFLNQPALICGAGPSLNDLSDELKLLQEKVLIFSGGRATSVLNDVQVQPHFILGIDPYRQHKDTLRCNNFFEAPLIYRSRMNHKALELAQGPLLYTPGATGYPFVSWLEKQLGIESFPFDEGLNVVNFNLSIAQFLGCNPIILVGTDLAYQKDSAYSKSIPDEQILPKRGRIEETDFTLNRGCMGLDKKGQPIFTLWKWMEEAKWIEGFAHRNPSLKIYNATPGGLQINGLENCQLTELTNSLKFPQCDYQSWAHQALQQAKINCYSTQTLHKILRSYELDIQASIQLLTHLAFQNTSSLEYELLEQEVREKISYQHLLTSLEHLFEQVEIESDAHNRKKKKYSFLLSQACKYNDLFETFLREKKPKV